MKFRLSLVPVHAAAAVRMADAAAQRDHGLPGRMLMQAAAGVALQDLRTCWPQARDLVVVCGAGNNAGDGYDLATQARAAGLRPMVVAVGAPESLRGDALAACRTWREAGGVCLPEAPSSAAQWSSSQWSSVLAGADVVVDALFGTGLARPVEGIWAEAVAAINAAGKPVLALDLPSGMDADTGAVLGTAVRASVTSAFVGWKAGLLLNPALAGRVRLHSLGVPAEAFAGAAAPLLWQLPLATLAGLPPRARDAHKGRHGHVMVVGGDIGMPGAVRLAGEAALRSGAGRVSVLTRQEHAPSLVVGCPELMVHAIAEGAVPEEPPAAQSDESLTARLTAQLATQMAGADAIVCGPGLGRRPWGAALLSGVIAAAGGRPVVLDADALMLLAASPQRLGSNFVLTPHPGEAAALLGVSVAVVQADRAAAVRALVARFGATCVLKGAATLTLGPGMGAPVACELGNPGMGTAGMGDVLAGVCGALAAQDVCDPAWQFAATEPMGWAGVAAVAVVAHAAAGDLAAARGGERGLLASDLFPWLRSVLNGRELPA